ncbi:MAG TPA: cupin domain-containing protein [Candidatus Choladousia intestinavium]|uniref:Cupin domain-containing protein n=1 Tax=Candidatus Choladousia intestinavium TaxID=2840727 RepID=A0A9D1ADR1_9FIRM|nr:cupin domain-containing protein [Candidatus Choladousia intestinavium]
MLDRIVTNPHKMEINHPMDESFPVNSGFSRLSDYAGREVLPHWHQAIETITVKEGRMLCATGERLYPLRQGESVIINGNVLHSFRPDG